MAHRSDLHGLATPDTALAWQHHKQMRGPAGCMATVLAGRPKAASRLRRDVDCAVRAALDDAFVHGVLGRVRRRYCAEDAPHVLQAWTYLPPFSCSPNSWLVPVRRHPHTCRRQHRRWRNLIATSLAKSAADERHVMQACGHWPARTFEGAAQCRKCTACSAAPTRRCAASALSLQRPSGASRTAPHGDGTGGAPSGSRFSIQYAMTEAGSAHCIAPAAASRSNESR